MNAIFVLMTVLAVAILLLWVAGTIASELNEESEVLHLRIDAIEDAISDLQVSAATIDQRTAAWDRVPDLELPPWINERKG